MRLADKVNYCASCFQQELSRKHVDLEAFFDGPTIRQENGDHFAIDDLILCDKCLKEAGELVGLFPANDLMKENEELGKALESRVAESDEKDEFISDLVATLEKLTGEKIKRPARRPRMLA